MKKALLVTTLGLSTLISFSNIQAADNRTEERVGFSSGLILGAIAGGPVGAIIGAASGAWLGDKVNEAEKVGPLNRQIANNKMQLNSLEKNIAQQRSILDQANILLAEQDHRLMKVANNKTLMTGLQIDVMFRSNSWQLESGAIEKIAPLVLMMEQFPQLELQLTGHGDTLGTNEGNTKVALERTLTVKQSFTNAGIESQRIHLTNSGRSEANASIEDVDGRALDRRVRIRFMQTQDKAVLALQ